MSRSGWHRRLAVAVAVLIALVLATILIARAVGTRRLEQAKAEFEREVGPLELAALMRPELPRERNAAVWLLEGAEQATALVPGAVSTAAVSRGGEVDLSRSIALEPIARWDDSDRARAQQLARVNQRAFATMARSLEFSEWSYGIDYREGPGADIPPLKELLRAARLVLIDAKVGLIEGDLGRFDRDVAVLDRLATSLTDESTLITSLVGIGVERCLLEAVWEISQVELPDSETLERTASILEAKEPQAQLRRGLNGEAALISDGLAGMRRLDPSYVGDPFAHRREAWLALPFDRLLTANTLADYVEISQSFDLPWPELDVLAAELGPEDRRGPLPSLAANLEAAVARLKEYESSLQLARLALDYRLNGSGGPVPADSFSGGPIELETLADGSARFTALGAEKLWQDRFQEMGSRTLPRFEWTVASP